MYLKALASVVAPHADSQGYIPIDRESCQGRLAEGTLSLGVENYGTTSAAVEVLRIEHVAKACTLSVGPWEEGRLFQVRTAVDGTYQEGSCGSPREDRPSGHLQACDVWSCGPLVIRPTFLWDYWFPTFQSHA